MVAAQCMRQCQHAWHCCAALPVQVDDFLEKSTREERQGLAFEGVPDADLFFVDKVGRTPASCWPLLGLAGVRELDGFLHCCWLLDILTRDTGCT